MFDVFLTPPYLDVSTSSCGTRLRHTVRLSVDVTFSDVYK
jgi:hypothetical protein